MANLLIKSLIFIVSACVDFKNFCLTGVLKNKSLIIMVVPFLVPTGSFKTSLPPSSTTFVPNGSSLVFVIISKRETEAIEANASPLKPKEYKS